MTNVLTSLVNAGVTPGGEYYLDQLEDAITGTLKVSEYLLQCEDKDDDSYFRTVELCFDLNYAIMECPMASMSDSQNCKDDKKINFPKFEV